MGKTPLSHQKQDEVTYYEVRIEGLLSDRWAMWFDGLTIIHEENGETRLIGPVVDQAALYGLLRKVRDVGLPLISVVRVDSDLGNTLDDQ